jgi:hypothetical protein
MRLMRCSGRAGLLAAGEKNLLENSHFEMVLLLAAEDQAFKAQLLADREAAIEQADITLRSTE